MLTWGEKSSGVNRMIRSLQRISMTWITVSAARKLCESLRANIYLGRTQGALFGDHLVTTHSRERTGDRVITKLIQINPHQSKIYTFIKSLAHNLHSPDHNNPTAEIGYILQGSFCQFLHLVFSGIVNLGRAPASTSGRDTSASNGSTTEKP